MIKRVRKREGRVLRVDQVNFNIKQEAPFSHKVEYMLWADPGISCLAKHP